MSQTIALSKKNPRYTFIINPESPFFKIIYVAVPDIIMKEDMLKSPDHWGVTIKIKKSREVNGKSEEDIFFQGNSIHGILKEGKVKVDEVYIDNDQFDKVELVYENSNEADIELKVNFITTNNNVSLENPFENFKRHITQENNVKILFSAPFGQGKTTFLNYFFEQNSDKYEVFKVFPVNYSISHNEDVFKYIKVEILFQLLGKGITFDQNDFSFSLTGAQFILNDPIRVLSPLVSLIPKIGKIIYDVVEPLYKLGKEYFNYHKNATKGDIDNAENFMKELYDKEGSIFEDNFYTQLIRSLLLQLKTKNKKRNVLIIEDLDRMDPDHIFRVLNVFTAHFDTLEYQDGYSNKFGFDKIIIVGDYYNIKHIYEYKYGPKVGFEGYINKYYSKEPFYYDNKKAIAVLIDDLKKGIQKDQNYTGLSLLICVVNDLVAAGNVTLRDMTKLLKMSVISNILEKSHNSNNSSKHFYHQFTYFNMFYYLTKTFEIDSLIQKFEEVKHKMPLSPNMNYHYLATLGLPSLVLNKADSFNFDYKYKSVFLTFIVELEWNPANGYEFYNVKNLQGVSENFTFSKFERLDFYEILILNARKYKEVGGFE